MNAEGIHAVDTISLKALNNQYLQMNAFRHTTYLV